MLVWERLDTEPPSAFAVFCALDDSDCVVAVDGSTVIAHVAVEAILPSINHISTGKVYYHCHPLHYHASEDEKIRIGLQVTTFWDFVFPSACSKHLQESCDPSCNPTIIFKLTNMHHQTACSLIHYHQVYCF